MSYSKFSSSDLILRDELAIDRTCLANERTLLAYLRSGLALLIAGASIVHFSTEAWYRATGIVCFPLGLAVTLVGMFRYRKMHRAITMVRNSSASKTLMPDADVSIIEKEAYGKEAGPVP